MLTLTFLPYLKRHLRICKFLICLPYEWDEKNGRVEVLRSKSKILIRRIEVILHVIYVIAMGIQLAKSPNPPFTLARKLQGAVFFSMWITALAFRLDWGMDERPVEFLNCLLEFEKRLLKEIKYTKSIEDKIMGLFLPLLFVSFIGFPLMNMLMLIVHPCSPPFIGSMLPICQVPGLQQQPHPHFLLWIPLLIFETWMFLQILHAGAFYPGYLFFLGVTCLLDYISILKTKVGLASISNIAVLKKPKTTKTQNLAERVKEAGMLKNDHEECLRMFRTIQLSSIMFNAFMKDRVLPAIITGIPSLQIFSFYVIIKLHEVIPMPGFTFFPILFVDAFVTDIIVVTVASNIFTRSTRLLRNWNKSIQQQNVNTAIHRKSLKKSIESCFPLKVQFGTNYIDQSTPLVIQNFCVEQTASLLMISNR